VKKSEILIRGTPSERVSGVGHGRGGGSRGGAGFRGKGGWSVLVLARITPRPSARGLGQSESQTGKEGRESTPSMKRVGAGG